MKRVFEKIVDHPKTMIIIFVVMVLLSFVAEKFVSVNYDMNDYLPDGSASTAALDVMAEEFDGGIPNARVLIKDVSIPEALAYKEKVSQVTGVTDVTWLDDVADITEPLAYLDQDTVSNYYVDKAALFSVTIAEAYRVPAVKTIREIIGDDNAMTGSAVTTSVATESTVREVQLISIFSVLFVLMVLTLTTTSWLEPAVVLIGLGVAVLINRGTNLIFGEISFVTNAAGNVLQLAVSLDYSVFLLHRFVEHRQQTNDVKQAMTTALEKSFGSIASSGFTTVIGFLALVLMRFKIGPDLGLALAKGVLISLITVFVFMPPFILTVYPWLDKTQHRSLMPSFKKFGVWVSRLMIPLAVIFLIIVTPAYLASNANQFYYGASHIFGANTKLGADTQTIEEIYGKKDTYVLLVPSTSAATEAELSKSLKDIPKVIDIISYVDLVGNEIPEQYLDKDTLLQLRSDHYSRFVISVDAAYEGEDTFNLVQTVRETANTYYPSAYYLAGEGVSTYDLMNTVTQDMTKVNLIAIGAVFLVLVLMLRSLTLPVLLVASIETAIWLNLSLYYFSNRPIFYMVYLIISTVQLGATVDYAILYTERYTEFRAEMTRIEAVQKTTSMVIVSILTSGSALMVVGFLLGKISTHGLLSQLGMCLGFGTLCSLTIVLFVLPGLLYMTDGLIGATTLGANFKQHIKKRLEKKIKKLQQQSLKIEKGK